MMLGRLKRDCDFYLGCGMKNAEYSLYCKDEKEQIKEMLHIYGVLTMKPVWIDVKTILWYAEQMRVYVKHGFLLRAEDFILRTWQSILYRKALRIN